MLLETEDVTEGDIDEAAHELAAQPLDPFGLVPDWASKMAGLGGPEEPRDLNYVLHTIYVPAAEGYAHFGLRFRGLTGKFGTMVLRVHMYQKGSTDARLAASDRVAISRLILLRGEYHIRFEAFHGVTYALYVGIDGMTDAAAGGVEVLLDRPGDDDAAPAAVTEARNTAFGRDAVKPTISIISAARATLKDPVSQRCTAAQVREAAFRSWSRQLGDRPEHIVDRWCSVYLLQVLERYGMLRPGAVGLGIGAGHSGVAALAAAAGATIEVVDGEEIPDLALARLRDAAPGVSIGKEALRYRAVDLAALPRDLVNFDFLWSERVASRHVEAAADGVRLAARMMACLRPGGLAVHVVDFALDPFEVTPMSNASVWRRRELDRLGLVMVSRGHEIAEIKVDESNAPTLECGVGQAGITAAGLIVRKALTVE